MKKLLADFISAMILLTLSSCAFEATSFSTDDRYTEYIQYRYYDYGYNRPIIYRGSVAYYVIWDNGFIYTRVPSYRYDYIRYYDYPRYYYNPYYYDYSRYRPSEPLYPNRPYYYNDTYYWNSSRFGKRNNYSRYERNGSGTVQQTPKPSYKPSFGNQKRTERFQPKVDIKPSNTISRPMNNGSNNRGKFGGHR